MKLNRTTVVLPLAGLLVIAGAGAVFATTAQAPVTGSGDTVVPAAESPSPSPASGATTPAKPAPTDTALTQVLDDLVAKGTITEAQKKAVLDGLVAERTARRDARKANRDQLKSFLADGVITQEEFNQLPADSPLRTMSGLMDDGKITTDELRSLRRETRQGLGRGLGRGQLKGIFGGNGNGPAASPAPSTGTSG